MLFYAIVYHTVYVSIYRTEATEAAEATSEAVETVSGKSSCEYLPTRVQQPRANGQAPYPHPASAPTCFIVPIYRRLTHNLPVHPYASSRQWTHALTCTLPVHPYASLCQWAGALPTICQCTHMLHRVNGQAPYPNPASTPTCFIVPMDRRLTHTLLVHPYASQCCVHTVYESCLLHTTDKLCILLN